MSNAKIAAELLLSSAKGKRGELDGLLETMDETELATAIIELSRRGESKRELFAAMAMQGLLAGKQFSATSAADIRAASYFSVAHADALLAQLSEDAP